MPAIDRNHGQYGQVHADPTGGATAVQLVSLNGYDIDLTTDKARATCFEDPNHVYNQGKPDIKFGYKGEYDKSADGLEIFRMALGTVAPYFKFIPNRLFPLQFFGGNGWSDAKLSCDANGNVTTSGSGVAAGAWVLPIDPA